jgi:hypothetical protein
MHFERLKRPGQHRTGQRLALAAKLRSRGTRTSQPAVHAAGTSPTANHEPDIPGIAHAERQRPPADPRAQPVPAAALAR